MSVATLTARPSGPLVGRVRAPGDKSISHRALILGALATGRTRIDGLLQSADVLATADAVAAIGADVSRGDDHWAVTGQGGLAQPTQIIDCGNSGNNPRSQRDYCRG